MPAFVCISGIIYYHIKRNLKRYNNEYTFIKKKIFRLIIPYIFFSIFVVFPTMYILGFVKANLLKYFITNYVLCLDNRHLWYLIMLFGIFIIFNHYEKYFHKYHTIFLFVSLILSMLHSLMPSFFGIANITYYFIYFYIGYLYGEHKNKLDVYLMKYPKSIIFYSCMVLFLFWALSTKLDNNYIIMIIKYITALSGTISLYTISLKMSSNKQIINNKFINLLNKDSYGIYLFHPMIIYLLFYNLAQNPIINISAYILAFIAFILSIGFSIILINLFRKLNLNLFIGEKL